MESCAPSLTSWNFFPLYRKSIPSFLLQCNGQGPGIAGRDNIKQKGREIFLYWEKNKNIIQACQSRYTFIFVSSLSTVRHLREIKDLSLPFYLLRKSFPLFKNCGISWIKVRKWISVTQSSLCYQVEWYFLPKIRQK